MPVAPDYNVIVPNLLWVGSHPERSGEVAGILASLKAAGAGAVLTLTERPLDAAALSQVGLAALHVPVENYGAPTLEQLRTGVAFIDQGRTRGSPTLVHCFAGIGRAGTMAAAYLIHGGASVDDAIAEVRRRRHSSCVESSAQHAALEEFARAKK
jgi:atypical dual specificity phosphatase